MLLGCCGVLLLLGTEAVKGAEAPDLKPVPLPVKAPRLLGMSMDDDGDIWLGSTHRIIYRYTPAREPSRKSSSHSIRQPARPFAQGRKSICWASRIPS